MNIRCSDISTNHLTQLRVLLRGLFPGFALLLACSFLSTVRSEPGDPLRYRGGLRNSPENKKLNPKQLDAVLKSFQEKTGFLELSFDENGFLKLGDRNNFSGGSATARALISAAVELEHSLDLQCHNFSSIVAFARLAKATVYQSRATGRSIDVYPIELDFTDFSKLRGDKRVLAAFDIGFVIMHELGHAVLGLRDAADETEGPGECEVYINQIRRELNLPERQNYIARTRTLSPLPSQRAIEHAELLFVHPVDGEGHPKPQKFSLFWEAMMVGPIRQITSPPAGARPGKPAVSSFNGQ